jgi:glucose/mannose-6-phosphate isomerase
VSGEDIRKLHAKFDKADMLGRVVSFPRQMEDAWRIGAEFVGNWSPGRFKTIVVCGMGGSAIGGDMLRSFFGNRLKAPLISCRDYTVPAYLGEDTFVVVSSYSGNTGETLSAYESVRGRGATVVAVSSGGKLEGMCEDDDVPFCRIPGGMPPRSAIAYSFFPMIQILRAAGLAAFDDAEFKEAHEAIGALCAEYGPESPANRALDLARKIHGRIPFIYSGPGLFEAVARRWSCQFNENSKSLAHFAQYTELNHNEIVGWEKMPEVLEKIIVFSLEDKDDHVNTRNQTEIGLGIIGKLAASVERIDGGGGGRLTRLLSAMILGDFASVYLALLGGVDPTPVEKIDYLKKQLRAVSR